MSADDGREHERGGALIRARPEMPDGQISYASADRDARNDVDRSVRALVLQACRVISKRRWLIASIIGLAAVIGLARTLMVTPLYTASVRLQIDRTAMKVVEGQVATTEGQEFDFLKTQFELLLSRNIAERAASSLQLGEDKEFLKARDAPLIDTIANLLASSVTGSGASNTVAAREMAAREIILVNRAIRPVVGSRLVDIIYTDPDPRRAQRVATALGDAYIASNLDKRFEANAYAKTFLDDQLKQLKVRLEESEKLMLGFAQKEQIVATAEKASIAEGNLATANTALGALISDRIKNEQLWRQVDQATAINLPQLLTNAVIDGLRARRNSLAAEYQEKLETFKPDYPAMVQLRNKLGELDRQLASEVRTIKASYKAAFEAAATQEMEMRARVDELKREVLDLQQRSIQYNILKRDVDTNRSLYETLLQRFKQVDIAGGVGANNVFIVDRAEVPRVPSSPHLARSLLLSLMLGLMGAAAAAFAAEFFDNRIGTPGELERVSGLPMLGLIPAETVGTPFEVQLTDARSGPSEALRSLAASLQFSTGHGLPRSLLLTSAGPDEGKSTTAIALAMNFANLGLKVLLIDGDLRRPLMHVKLGMSNDRGFSDVLCGNLRLMEAIRASATTNLYVLTSGATPSNPTELLGGSCLGALLSAAEEIVDVVIVDGPPVMGIADAPTLAHAAAATLFVAAAGEARSGTVIEALRRLRQARARIVGSVLTKFDARAAGYGHGYGYGVYGGYETYRHGDDGHRFGDQR